MSTTQAPPASPHGADALIREARRRQRRRRWGVGLVIVVAATLAWVTVSGQSGGGGSTPGVRVTPPPHRPGHQTQSVRAIPRRVDTTLLLWNPGRSYVDDLGTRQRSSRAPVLRHIAYGDYQPLALVVGNKVVFVGNGLSVVGSGLTAEPRALSRRTSFFAPASEPGHVWAIYGTDRHRVAHLVSVRSGRASRSIDLPLDTVLVRGTDGGLLLESHASDGASLELWRPGSAARPLPHRAQWGNGFAATPRLIAYGGRCRRLTPRAEYEPTACRVLRVFDVVSGQSVSYASPRGTLGWVPFEFNLVDAFNHAATHLAAEAAIAPARDHQGRLFTVQLNAPHQAAAAVPRSRGSIRARVAWSSRGNWLFYQGPSNRLWAYQPRTGTVRGSATPCCRYTIMAAVPHAATS
jgi:hypothetical protein